MCQQLTNASRSNSPYPPEPQKDTEIQEMEYHFMVASEEESDWETPLSEGEEETAGGRKVAHSFMVRRLTGWTGCLILLAIGVQVRGATGRASWELVPGYPSKSTGDDTR